MRRDADGEGVVNVMSDCPELVGVLHYVEFYLEIIFSGKPVFFFSREEEFVALQLQETIENIGFVACTGAGERSTVIGESEGGCIAIVPFVYNLYFGSFHECVGQGNAFAFLLQKVGNLDVRHLHLNTCHLVLRVASTRQGLACLYLFILGFTILLQ